MTGGATDSKHSSSSFGQRLAALRSAMVALAAATILREGSKRITKLTGRRP